MSALQSFGKYTLKTRPLQLMEGDRPVRLPLNQLHVLELLLRAGGKVLSKELLMNKVWAGRIVEEANLSQSIFLIRRALGKLPSGNDYVETVPRFGYRLAAEAMEAKPGAYRLAANAASNGSSDPVGQAGEYQFRTLVESIEDYAIYMLDCGGRVLTWNRGAERSKGYRSAEVVGQHYSMFFVPEDISNHVPDRELSVASGTGRCSGEGWRIRKNGERFWASFAITAMRGPNGKLIGFAKIVRDLSERKRHDDALSRMEALMRRERDRLHAAAESSMDALFICEAVRDERGDIEDFVFTYLNTNVEKMVSIPREALLRGRMCDLLPVNRTQGLFDAYKRVVQTGEPYIAEFPIQAENVSSEWIRLRAVRLDDGVVITASDITEQKRHRDSI